MTKNCQVSTNEARKASGGSTVAFLVKGWLTSGAFPSRLCVRVSPCLAPLTTPPDEQSLMTLSTSPATQPAPNENNNCCFFSPLLLSPKCCTLCSETHCHSYQQCAYLNSLVWLVGESLPFASKHLQRLMSKCGTREFNILPVAQPNTWIYPEAARITDNYSKSSSLTMKSMKEQKHKMIWFRLQLCEFLLLCQKLFCHDFFFSFENKNNDTTLGKS